MNKKLNLVHMAIISMVIATSLLCGTVYAESEITLVSEKSIFEPTARIFLTGTVDPGDQFYEPVTITVYDMNGDEIIQVQSPVEDNAYSALITGPLGSFEKGVYGIESTHVSATNVANIVIGIDDLVHDESYLMHLTPLKQLKIGTDPEHVVCMDSQILIQNNHRDSVACVNPSTALSLENRGWGTLY
ncbi:MAG: hypothetical protein K5777_05145 [Nitrosopumilus sp.]|nr:hypothetical protein [Nitrosopumilus sp.]